MDKSAIAKTVTQYMIERADQGLYVAKKTGRNRTFLMPASREQDARAA